MKSRVYRRDLWEWWGRPTCNIPINTHRVLHSWLIPVSEQKDVLRAGESHGG